MSLTSYRAAPPRDKSLQPFRKAETEGSTPKGAASVRRLPEKATLGLGGLKVAGRMYQCPPALERPAGDFYGFCDSKNLKKRAVFRDIRRKQPVRRNFSRGRRRYRKRRRTMRLVHVSRKPPSTVTTVPVM